MKNYRKRIKFHDFTSKIPRISFVLTIHNHGSIFEKVLLGILSSSSLDIEIIIVDDNSRDDSFLRLSKFVASDQLPENLTRIIYIRNFIQQFEVHCENTGSKFARGEFLCFVQGDMVIQDLLFDKRLISALLHYPAIGAISGTSVKVDVQKSKNRWLNSPGHSLINLKLLRFLFKTFFSKNQVYEKNFHSKKSNIYNQDTIWAEDLTNVSTCSLDFNKYGQIRYGDNSKGISQNIIDSKIIFVGRLINRGPIFVKTKIFNSINGFDSKSYFQGFDDYEFSLRLGLLNLSVAYSPINFISEKDWGAGKKKKSISTYCLIRFKSFVRVYKRKFTLLSNPIQIENNIIGKTLFFK